MTAAKHTPGPWSVVDSYYPSFREIKGLSFKLIVCVSASDISLEDYMQREADMALIAAAPDLLELLMLACAELKFGNPRTVATDTYRYNNELIHRIDAAIAKATGVQP